MSNLRNSQKFLEQKSFIDFFKKLKISSKNQAAEKFQKMNRALSGYSDTSSIDEETLLQQELARLQRQYRVMENERKEVSGRFWAEGSIQGLAKTRDPRIKTG